MQHYLLFITTYANIIIQMLQFKKAQLLFMLSSTNMTPRILTLFLAVNLMLPGLATMVIFILVQTTVFTIVAVTASMTNAALPQPKPFFPIHTTLQIKTLVVTRETETETETNASEVTFHMTLLGCEYHLLGNTIS